MAGAQLTMHNKHYGFQVAAAQKSLLQRCNSVGIAFFPEHLHEVLALREEPRVGTSSFHDCNLLDILYLRDQEPGDKV